jgi:hypothetical protein
MKLNSADVNIVFGDEGVTKFKGKVNIRRMEQNWKYLIK